MRLKLLFLVIFLLGFFTNPLKVFAADEFSTSYNVNYNVQSDGTAEVTQKISLKNLTSQYYVSNFTLTIGSTTVSDVNASDDSGPMQVDTESKGTKTSINIKFNKQVAGLGKTQDFTLKFKSKDFAQAIGRTWEVNLPRVPETSNIEKYNLVLSVPLSFGDPTSISPDPRSQSQTFDRIFMTFDKDQIQKNGVSVNFGTTQVFDFNLKYHLENTSLFPVVTSVTLPPDTQYQDVLISRISPEPQNVTVDKDGNYLAWYRLQRGEKEDVTVAGSAKLYITAKNKDRVVLSPEDLQVLTKSDQYWEKDNPAIKNTLAEIFKNAVPNTNREKAELIYRYVVDNLKYDNSRLNSSDIERLGAVTVLNNPTSAVCMEFTDLFIALSRAAGVQARELDGFAYSQNTTLRPLSLSKDLLHAWPEYYDNSKGWVMVDPTWENTSGGVDYFNKFDLNHLTLAIKGYSSKTPYTSDDVKATISNADFLAKPQLEVSVDIPSSIWAGFPATVSVKVLNQGNSVQSPTTLTLGTGQIAVLGQSSVGLGPIPPYGSTTYQFNLRTPNLWQGFDDDITVLVAGQRFTKKVSVRPLFIFQSFPFVLLGIGAVIFGIYGAILALHIYKKRSHLRTKKS